MAVANPDLVDFFEDWLEELERKTLAAVKEKV
jgi:hypothetical protein